jgi:hypothetical protein
MQFMHKLHKNPATGCSDLNSTTVLSKICAAYQSATPDCPKSANLAARRPATVHLQLLYHLFTFNDPP